VFRRRKRGQIVGAIIPRNIRFVVNVVPGDPVKPVFRHGHKPMNIDDAASATSAVNPTFISLPVGSEMDVWLFSGATGPSIYLVLVEPAVNCRFGHVELVGHFR